MTPTSTSPVSREQIEARAMNAISGELLFQYGLSNIIAHGWAGGIVAAIKEADLCFSDQLALDHTPPAADAGLAHPPCKESLHTAPAALADVVRAAALEEAAQIAEADHTPAYGSHNSHMEWFAETQRKVIAEHIRSAVRQPSPVTDKIAGAATTLRYTNWRGETADRTILPIRVIYGTNEWHKEPCYMIEALDLEKGEVRTFALAGFGGIDPDPREAATLLSPHQSTAPDRGSF